MDGVFDGRSFRRVRKNSARIHELEAHNEALMRGKEQAAITAVKDIEDWIFIVQTRTLAFEMLRRIADGEKIGSDELNALLDNVKVEARNK
jgi:hypothetical protein